MPYYKRYIIECDFCQKTKSYYSKNDVSDVHGKNDIIFFLKKNINRFLTWGILYLTIV